MLSIIAESTKRSQKHVGFLLSNHPVVYVVLGRDMTIASFIVPKDLDAHLHTHRCSESGRRMSIPRVTHGNRTQALSCSSLKHSGGRDMARGEMLHV